MLWVDWLGKLVETSVWETSRSRHPTRTGSVAASWVWGSGRACDRWARISLSATVAVERCGRCRREGAAWR